MWEGLFAALLTSTVSFMLPMMVACQVGLCVLCVHIIKVEHLLRVQRSTQGSYAMHGVIEQWTEGAHDRKSGGGGGGGLKSDA